MPPIGTIPIFKWALITTCCHATCPGRGPRSGRMAPTRKFSSHHVSLHDPVVMKRRVGLPSGASSPAHHVSPRDLLLGDDQVRGLAFCSWDLRLPRVPYFRLHRHSGYFHCPPAHCWGTLFDRSMLPLRFINVRFYIPGGESSKPEANLWLPCAFCELWVLLGCFQSAIPILCCLLPHLLNSCYFLIWTPHLEEKN
jgi:hypothetical protein